MKRFIAMLLAFALLCAGSALAAEGRANVRMDGDTYSLTLTGVGVVDGTLNVVLVGFGDTLKMGPTGPLVAAYPVARYGGETVRCTVMRANIGGPFVFEFDRDTLPDEIWLDPTDRNEPDVLIWETGDDIGDVVSASNAEPLSGLPDEIGGEWHGAGEPKDGGPAIGLTACVYEDGSGYFTFERPGFRESYDFILESRDGTFSCDIPDYLELSVTQCEGIWALAEGRLLFDFTMALTDGALYAYSAECEKVIAPEYEVMTFGNWDQDGDSGNGAEPIEWLIVERDGGTATLVSKYALDRVPFDEHAVAGTWDGCTLRRWLNGEFLSAAFAEEERARILKTAVSAEPNPDWATDPGADTEDFVYILSFGEARRYFPTDQSRMAKTTQTGVDHGAYVNRSLGGCMWWLRTPGDAEGYVLSVLSFGMLDTNGGVTDYSITCVRPAIRLRLD